MKHIKWRMLFITSCICLVPVILGVLLWDRLPDTIAVHFDINNNADNFASKGFVVFGLPLLMTAMQWVCSVTSDINVYKHGGKSKIERVSKWIVPCMSAVVQSSILGYALGYNIDIRRVAILLVSGVFIVTGICLPKSDYIKNYDIDAEKAKKINRFIGIETLAMGILGLVSVFLPSVSGIVWLIMLIPYAVAGILYGIKNK